ncbi:50S ribosomal protein L17 [Patescibacteria group bacterium]|nr:50S ribosomal protein L17 [Patescibacteria group bacterium]
MRKKNKGRKFARPRNQRKALLKSIAQNLFLHEKIKTTEAKAKEAKMVIEKMITRAKKGGLANTRLLRKELSIVAVKKIVNELVPRYKTRKGGYTKIIKLGQRQTDGARMAIIELVK